MHKFFPFIKLGIKATISFTCYKYRRPSFSDVTRVFYFSRLFVTRERIDYPGILFFLGEKANKKAPNSFPLLFACYPWGETPVNNKGRQYSSLTPIIGK